MWLAHLQAKKPYIEALLEKAKVYATQRDGKILALRVPADYRAAVAKIQKAYGFRTYTDAVRFCFAVGVAALEQEGKP